jgi:hypothetical protein
VLSFGNANGSPDGSFWWSPDRELLRGDDDSHAGWRSPVNPGLTPAFQKRMFSRQILLELIGIGVFPDIFDERSLRLSIQ